MPDEVELLPLEYPEYESQEDLPSDEERTELREKVIARLAEREQPTLTEQDYEMPELRHGATVKLKLTPHQIVRATTVSRYLLDGVPEVFAADYVGLETAVACTTTQLESGGRNIYGADPASSWMNRGPFGTLWERPVTPGNFKWFWSEVEKGAVSNGVGAKQLTSASLIAAANRRGGAWIPEHNCAEGDEFFLELIHETGSLWAAFYHYNGSGAAADAYANNALAIVGDWRERGVNK